MSTVAKKVIMGSGAVAGAYEIDQSLIFNKASAAKLERTPSSGGNRRTFTISTWFKIGEAAVSNYSYYLFGAHVNGQNNDNSFFSVIFYNGDLRVSGWNQNWLRTNRVFRDPSAWYHVVVAVDTTSGTANNRVRIYINGVEETSFAVRNNPDQNFDFPVNRVSYPQTVGSVSYASAKYWDGYMAEYHLIDGTALTPSSFGETNSDTGQWTPIEYEGGSYGTNGFYLKFASGALGTDSSGEGNNYTATNLVNADVVPDSPTNNFATMNPLVYRTANGTQVYSEGNLKYGQPTANSWGFGFTTLNVKSGKWYAEIRCPGVTGGVTAGVSNVGHYGLQHFLGQNPQDATGQWILYLYGTTTKSRFNGSLASETYSVFNTGQILGIALNADDKELSFYVDGTLQSSLGSSGVVDISTGGSANDEWSFFASTYYGASGAITWNFGQNSSFLGTETATSNSDENGVGAFHTTPPSGYLALCTANLPDPAIPLPEEHFNAVIWSGNSTDNRVIPVGFAADLTWFKQRTGANSLGLFDTVRGNSNPNGLSSNSTSAEFDWTGIFKGHTSTGFTVGTSTASNASSNTYVAWNWKANGSGSTNTVGSLDSVVSANAAAGFSIVTYTGNGSAQSIGHGLSKDLELIFVKNREATSSWVTQWVGNPLADYMYLNDTRGQSTTTIFNLDITRSNDGTFHYGVAQYLGANNIDYVAYCFHSVAGYSKIGEYTGNGNDPDGPFVNLGFKPAWVLIKDTTGSSNGWILFDSARSPFNEVGLYLLPNSSAAEADYDRIDLLSNGFKLRHNYGGDNANNSVYLYMAFAEAPFKYANAR